MLLVCPLTQQRETEQSARRVRAARVGLKFVPIDCRPKNLVFNPRGPAKFGRTSDQSYYFRKESPPLSQFNFGERPLTCMALGCMEKSDTEVLQGLQYFSPPINKRAFPDMIKNVAA